MKGRHVIAILLLLVVAYLLLRNGKANSIISSISSNVRSNVNPPSGIGTSLPTDTSTGNYGNGILG